MGGESDSMAFGVAAHYAKSFLVSLIPTNKKPCCINGDPPHHHHHHHHARTSSSSLSSPSSSPSSLSSSSSSSLVGVNMADYNDSQVGVSNHTPSPTPSSYFSIRRLKSRLSSSSSSMNSSSSSSSSSRSSSTRDDQLPAPSHHYFKSARKLKSMVWDVIKANKGKPRLEVPTTLPPHEVQAQLVINALEVEPPSPKCIDQDEQQYYCSQQVEFHSDYYSSLTEEDFKTVVDDFIQRFNQHVAQEEHAFLCS